MKEYSNKTRPQGAVCISLPVGVPGTVGLTVGLGGTKKEWQIRIGLLLDDLTITFKKRVTMSQKPLNSFLKSRC